MDISPDDLDDLARFAHELEASTPWDTLPEPERDGLRLHVRLAINRNRPTFLAALHLLERVSARAHEEGRIEAENEQPKRDRCMGCGNEFVTEGGDIPWHACMGDGAKR